MSEEEQKSSVLSTAPPVTAAQDEDSDPGYEDLDDILDQFNPSTTTAAKPSTSIQDDSSSAAAAPPSSTGPGRPPFSTQASTQSEADFLSELQKEFAKTMSSMGIADSESDAQKQAREITDMSKEVEHFTSQMEKEGIQPEDLLRAILGEEGIDPAKIHESSFKGTAPASTSTEEKTSSTTAESKGTFEDTIRQTLERMQASDSSARDAQHSTSDSDDDILAQLMKAMESVEGGKSDGDDSDLSNLFLNMMHQLTSKDLLYEPMKELDTKFPDWLEKNKGKLKAEDQERYSTQQSVVKEIVRKFEEPSYSDADEKDRAFVWEKMQQMQAAGSPPEDLISAPFPGAFGGGVGDETGQDPLSNCPTQ